jgi:DNA-binding response OmpR family regulator
MAVLIVEDDEDTREFLVDMFASEGVVATASPTAPNALGELAKSSFDLVLLDIGLPDMNGLDFLEVLVKSAALESTPVIVTSGFQLDDAGVRDRKNVVDAFVKPYDFAALSASVHRHLPR